MAQITIEGEAKLLKKILNKIHEMDLEGNISVKSESIDEEDLDVRIGMDGTVHI